MFNEMPTLQSANQHRENPWLFKVEEESRVIKDQRNEGGKAKGYNPTKYQKQCAKCLIDFSCGSSQQKYCSIRCYGDHSQIKKANPYKELKCISCLSSLGFGCKAIAKRLYKVNHATVRNIVIAKGFSRSSSKQAAIRFVDTGNKIKVTESEKNRRELIKRIDLSLTKIRRFKKRIDLIIRAQKNGMAHWRDQTTANIYYWANIEKSRLHGCERAKRRVVLNGSHNHIKRICSRMIWRAIRLGYVKKQKTMQYFGCASDELKVHLQSKFKHGMSWNNYGSVWEVDHIVPCDSFDLTDDYQVRLCNHYTNLQPMLKYLNRSKSNKFIGSPVQLQIL
jgi:hypothetical protein